MIITCDQTHKFGPGVLNTSEFTFCKKNQAVILVLLLLPGRNQCQL